MPTSLASGDELQDRLQASLGDAYTIERELAPGGMSRLFLATEASLERKVVIKLLPPETASEVSAARFQREVLVAAHLQHPNILPVLTTGTTRDGIFYYIMPYVSGESLRERLERPERMSIPEAVRVLREIADALAMAHDRGIVHRDIKPANILLQEGHAVITDFGIARAVEAARAGTSERLTATGVGIGTLGYMAPEQLAGERDLDTRADVYALAVVGYEMLAGKPPFSRPTAQALVAAHLTEPPPPLSTVASDVPVAVEAVISKALSKAPEDRYRTAAEFRNALDLRLTQAFAAVAEPPKARVSKGVLIAAGVVAALGIGAAAYVLRPPPVNRNSVVVLPFNIRGSDTTLRQGLVDILYEGVNGRGWVKVVPPSTYLRTWKDKADDGTAAQLGRRTGAALAIYGSVDPVGTDSIVVSASILDVAHGKPLGVQIVRRGAKNNLPVLGGDVVKAVLKELDKWQPLAAFRTTWIEETNPSALQAFLIAEQFYRRSAWDSAMAYYARAIDADSGFALAHHHAGLVVGWRRSTDDSISNAYLITAARYNRGLPSRDSLLIVADSVRAALPTSTDTMYNGNIRRLFATLRRARDEFPTDPETWFALGDAYFHYGTGPSLSIDEDTTLAAFDHAIQLDSGFTPSYIHAIELRLAHDGRDAGLRYAERYLALQPTDDEADAVRVLEALLRDRGISDRTGKILDTLSSAALQTAWLMTRRWTDSAQTAVHLLELPMTGRRGSSTFFSDPGTRRILLARELAYRGRVHDAFATIGTNVGPLEADLFGVLAMFDGVPHDTAAAVFARWLHDPSIWVGPALPWWAARRDTVSLLASVARADSQLASAPAARRRVLTYHAAAARAYLSLGRRSTDVLARFQTLPDSLCLACTPDRFVKAKVLDSLGRHEDAEHLLHERSYTILGVIETRSALERATIAERVQHYGVASRAYALVGRAWAVGDPPLRTIASQALAKAAQLGGSASLAQVNR